MRVSGRMGHVMNGFDKYHYSWSLDPFLDYTVETCLKKALFFFLTVHWWWTLPTQISAFFTGIGMIVWGEIIITRHNTLQFFKKLFVACLFIPSWLYVMFKFPYPPQIENKDGFNLSHCLTLEMLEFSYSLKINLFCWLPVLHQYG